MKKPRIQYKQEAKDILAGKYEKPIIILLIFFVVNSIMGSLIAATGAKYSTTFPYEVTDPGNPALNTLLSIGSFLISAAMAYAIIKLSIHIYHKIELVPEKIVLSGFKENFLRNAFLQFMRGLFIFLWMLLLIIPGIVKAYAYSMSFYIVNREPESEAMAAITKSKEYMYGNKTDLFMLDLSYLGWYILGLFTFGILWLWIIPKHLVARVMYFEEIYNEKMPEKEPELEQI